MAKLAIYLDHNAAAPLLPEVRAALIAALELTGNPSSVHAHGRKLYNLIENSRDQVAGLVGAERTQLVFTGSASEAITQAIVGGATALPVQRIIMSHGEHSASMSAADASRLPIHKIGLDGDGVIRVGELADALRRAEAAGETVLVAVHWVNNETGVVQPMAAINALVGASPHYLFVDAVQALGKLDLEFSANASDMMAISGHKIGATAGVGALLMKSHADQVRLIPGGGQEQGRRGGTQSAAVIAGFGAAAAAFGEYYQAAEPKTLVQELENGLKRLASDLIIFGANAERIGNVVNFSVPGMSSAVAMMGLDLLGLSVSSGSACSSGKVGRSHVLSAMGIEPEIADCALRVSLGWNSTSDDVAAFLAGFETVLTRQRSRAA
ncbi:aminotransferase class V-fold PLP-dependent enzyme [Devosia rhodophyticola]|uniref:Cysteine desulfurase n=1 Tax=Devosia rhodophyticola TaxID=3026423 RepID=A0ABY7YWC9_9HYPH|nr:aminotransferase class V-fold PLP-dependent enzyme [Devosia rhodophyticola]WDR05673.1 aminotransferase class V-fold PLP-dependent enzyme [Devosia rhodophyticola]